MLFHVKTMSSHQCAAGTRQWKSQSQGAGPSTPTSRCRGSPDAATRATDHGVEMVVNSQLAVAIAGIGVAFGVDLGGAH